MAATVLNSLLQDPSPLVPLTVAQYHQLIRSGALQEGAPIELLDGLLIRKDRSQAGRNPMTVGHQHATTVMRLSQMLRVAESHGCHVRVQQPITIPPHDEPEPDIALVRGTINDYSEAHPGPDDVLCIIEVSDRSLRFDRTTKQSIYARAAIDRYVIVNLIDQTVEDFHNPDSNAGTYDHPAVLRPGDTLSISVPDGTVPLAVADLLPGE